MSVEVVLYLKVLAEVWWCAVVSSFVPKPLKPLWATAIGNCPHLPDNEREIEFYSGNR